jgi:hypothetical protein
MQINYVYKVLSANTETRTMEVKYTSAEFGEMHIYARLPYEGETLEAVIQQYSPVAYWREKATAVQTIDLETAFGVINYSDEPSINDRADQVRALRNQMLLLCDYTQLPDAPSSIDKEAWAVYRQELRDITSQTGFPDTIIWPAIPQ